VFSFLNKITQNPSVKIKSGVFFDLDDCWKAQIGNSRLYLSFVQNIGRSGFDWATVLRK
jgi:3-methyladenine DNA glycosylase Tag